MRIRLATPADLPAIVDISNWAALNTPANFSIAPETLQSWTDSYLQTNRMHPWLVAVDDHDRVIGFAKSGPHKGRCAYAWAAEVSVYIDPKHHGQGIGTTLYTQLISMLKEQGYVTLIAGITVPNPANEKLHAAFDFKPIGVFERVGWKFNRWHDVAYWEAFLDASTNPPGAIQPVANTSFAKRQTAVS